MSVTTMAAPATDATLISGHEHPVRLLETVDVLSDGHVTVFGQCDTCERKVFMVFDGIDDLHSALAVAQANKPAA